MNIVLNRSEFKLRFQRDDRLCVPAGWESHIRPHEEEISE